MDKDRQPVANSEFWRTEELADDESFRQWLQQEFPTEAFESLDRVSRRRFLQVMASHWR